MAGLLLKLVVVLLLVEELDASFGEFAIVQPQDEVLGQANRHLAVEDVALEG